MFYQSTYEFIHVKTDTLVSVLLPVYNGERFVGDAIESVLTSEYDSFELLIGDDCSTDRTDEVVAEYTDDDRVRLHKNETNLGIPENLNRLSGRATGDVLAFIDQDDLWTPNKLSRHVSAHERSGDDVIYSDMVLQYVANDTRREMELPDPAPPGMPLVRQLFREHNFLRTFSSVSITAEAWEAVDGLEEDLRLAADYDLWLRLAADHAFRRIPEQLVTKQHHDENFAKNYRIEHADNQHIIEWVSREYPELRALADRKRAERDYHRALNAYGADQPRETFEYSLRSLRRRIRTASAVLAACSLADLVVGPSHRVGQRGWTLFQMLR